MAGGTVTISGGNVIHTFTSSGYLTPIKYASRSLRFRSSANAYLNRTPTVAGNRKTWTWSGWTKRGNMATGAAQFLFSARSGSPWGGIVLENSTGQLQVTFTAGVSGGTYTSAYYRDPSAWYHIVVAVDTTQATAADRIKVYVNGVQVTSFSSTNYPSQNFDTQFNSTIAHYLGCSQSSTENVDGYMTEVNFIDGQALTPSSFGTFNSYGVWQPITYGGSYGTNGFYLTFGNNTSTTTLGYDTSPAGNNWTTNNISVTTGATYDSMLDVPTLTSVTVANYATFNPLSRTACTITNGNLQAVGDGGNYDNLPATIAFDGGGSDGFYWEFTSISNNSSTVVGICSINNSELNQANPTFSFANSADGWGYLGNGDKVNSGTTSSYGNSWTNNDVIGIAVKNGKIWFSKNGTFQASGNPAAGTNEAFSGISGLVYPVAGINGTNGFIVNFGQRPFTYTPPTGFVALNTYNLSTPTIPNGAVYMAATTYAGSASTQVINSNLTSLNFAWIKDRTSARSHVLVDTVRSGSPMLTLYSDLTAAEDNSSSNYNPTSISGSSITLGGAKLGINTSGDNYVMWGWSAGSSNVTNTSGSITSTVSANTTAGFSVATYTAPSGTFTFGHGLGVTPNFVIIKRTDSTSNWQVWVTGFTAKQSLYLNATNAVDASGSNWFAVTSSTVQITTGQFTTTGNFLAYCFAAIAGYSAFGSYTGNGSTDGPFVYLGFRPRFMLFKNTTNAGNSWEIYDTTRSTYNATNLELKPDSSGAESTGGDVDFLSNGFKIRTTSSAFNTSSSTFIYMAFAENPFKYSSAR
jgi:hypothetical protein